MKVIADYAAYRVVECPKGKKFKHGDEFVIGFKSKHGDVLYDFFRFGTVAGYAIELGDDPFEAVEMCKRFMEERPHDGHKLYWVNRQAVCVSDRPAPRKTVIALDFGDVVTLQGRRFGLRRAPNVNVELVEVEVEVVDTFMKEV